MDALPSTDSLQQAEVALRALQRAEQTAQQRRRVSLRWRLISWTAGVL
ncbi:MAG: hypothetical protein AB7T59_15225 [Hyphomonadaceae bacterium]